MKVAKPPAIRLSGRPRRARRDQRIGVPGVSGIEALGRRVARLEGLVEELLTEAQDGSGDPVAEDSIAFRDEARARRREEGRFQ